MKYCIVKGEGIPLSNALSELTEKVNQKLKEGWEPQGGVAVALTDYEWFHACQAMIKNDNNSNKNNNCC